MYADLSYGLEKEKECLECLENIFGKVEHTKSIYCHWDYENKHSIIEIKTRRVSKYHYPTTILGMNKVKAMLEDPRDAYSVFNFTDGIWGYPIDKESIECCKEDKGGRTDRGSYEINQYLYIPTDKLILLKKKLPK